MPCDCITKMDTILAEKNSRLVVSFAFAADGDNWVYPSLRTEKIEPRKREIVSAAPTFCPFCGTRYRAASES
jgi:hypothetical protein